MPRIIKNSKISSSAQQRIAEKVKSSWEFSLNVFSLELSEEISKQMIRKNINKAQLAQMLGTSRSYITQLLTGKPNLTLSTFFKLCHTIGLKPVTHFETEPLVASVLEKGVMVSTHIPTQISFTIQEMTEYEEVH